ncbi:F0F1 ATP synthase subunit gamma [Algoriphagus persicinus]|uniref:F0F1 ATP synthase subunit gamma n=1 Tax=Algoriphagus persicinus TaxID=3108754 RepID=UPI002B3D0CB5|nr:F0F1 ATP synthase subunit gamma [Algoriphagus sp. E1-3-M2]MEB2787095.1 F0F1 ATP synthase subunit gamma [Algoriphagus sp. E1-3-M2]
MDTLENLRRKLDGAKDLKSVVRTMKAVAASNIGQYELAVSSLGDYYRTVTLGIVAYFKAENIDHVRINTESKLKEGQIGAIVFGSDQGLVGQFNDSLVRFVSESLHHLPEKNKIWAVGERVRLLLSDVGFKTEQIFNVPNSVHAITPLIGEILIKAQEQLEQGKLTAFYIFHNEPKDGAGYAPVMQRLLPLDEKWKNIFEEFQWPTKSIPQVAGGSKPTVSALIREYLFVSLFKACAESLASENASRLAAMQRAEKNIEELLDDLGNSFHRLRQSSIDEELFDVVAGFENLKEDYNKNHT